MSGHYQPSLATTIPCDRLALMRIPCKRLSCQQGVFCVSLDFELYWGVRDKLSLVEYRDNLLGVRNAIPRMLALFQEYEIHATWATVGLLFFETKQQLLRALPEIRPD